MPIVHKGVVKVSAFMYAGFGAYNADRFPINMVVALAKDINTPTIKILLLASFFATFETLPT